ncbi:MAG: ATP-binding cassette domain-containing protein, partial [Sphingomonadales bacterium]
MNEKPLSPQPEDGIAIRVRGLRTSFGEQVVHENLDLDVRDGEILGVVGGSGTGKSVLMRAIIGLQKPDAGEISVFGESTVNRSDEATLELR